MKINDETCPDFFIAEKKYDPVLIHEWIIRMPDDKADELLVDVVMSEMRTKLKRKREAGRGGWFGPTCSNKLLHKMLVEHVEKGDMIDVINLAAMIMTRTKLFGDRA